MMRGPVFSNRDRRELELAVRKIKPDGRSYCTVPEGHLERHGWGLDPLAAIEHYRAERNAEAAEDGRQSWDDTIITVCSDEEAGNPEKMFVLEARITVRATRQEKALRMIGDFLHGLANGNADEEPPFGGHLEFGEEED